MGNDIIITIDYRIQAYNSIMCGFFCIGFIDFMLKSRSLLEYTNLFSSNECEKNEKIIITDKKNMIKMIKITKNLLYYLW